MKHKHITPKTPQKDNDPIFNSLAKIGKRVRWSIATMIILLVGIVVASQIFVK